MINNILTRCLLELKSDSPRIDYVRGMLETLIEMNHPTIEQASKAAGMDKLLPALAKTKGEGDALDATASARIAAVKQMAAQSTELL